MRFEGFEDSFKCRFLAGNPGPQVCGPQICVPEVK